MFELEKLQSNGQQAQETMVRNLDAIIDVTTKTVELQQGLISFWVGHCMAQFRANGEALQRLSGCREINAAVEICSDWATEALRRQHQGTAEISKQISGIGENAVAIFKTHTASLSAAAETATAALGAVIPLKAAKGERRAV